MLIQNMPKNLHSKIRAMSDTKIRKIMDMMRIRIHFYSDLVNHSYFFEEPSYDNQIGQKFLKKLKQSNDVKREILADLIVLFES